MADYRHFAKLDVGRRGFGYSECALVHAHLVDGLVSSIERVIR